VNLIGRMGTAVLMSAVLVGGLALVGCDDNVEVIRDPQIKVAKGMTWAWRPIGPPPLAPASRRDADGRPVTSRDVITQQPTQRLESNRDWNTEENRQKLQAAIERGLASKGLTKVADPAGAGDRRKSPIRMCAGTKAPSS
jgi:hypothetical protein